MQASKIKPNGIYAIQRNGLTRFSVQAVVTRRYRNTGSPHDYASTVEGEVTEPDHPDHGKALVLSPDAILGPYVEYAELVARTKAEKAALEARKQADAEAWRDLWRTLYHATGLPCPNDERDYKQPFCLSFGGGVEIKEAGRVALHKLLEDTRALLD